MSKERPENLLSILERMKDEVKHSKGQLRVTAYLPADRDYFRIEYDPQQNTSVYTKYTSCEGDQRETIEEFWPSRMYDVFSTAGAVMCVEFQGCESEWFDSNRDPNCASQIFHFIISRPGKAVGTPVESDAERKRNSGGKLPDGYPPAVQ